MKVTFLNTFENYGGAGYAALRIFEAMKQHTSGEYSFFPLYRGSFNRYHPANFPGLIRIGLEKARLRKQIKNPGDLFKFETGELGGKVAGRGTITRSDLLHLHWVNQGFLSIPTLVKLARLKPLVWTLHDMWAFTGGCSHSYDCERYRESCGQCPYLRSGRKDDLSNRIWHRKQEIYNTGKIALVGPSRWITQRAGQSSLGMLAEIVHIPNPLDTELFSPGDKLKARQALSIDPDKTVLIFGAQNIERKVWRLTRPTSSCTSREPYPLGPMKTWTWWALWPTPSGTS